MFSVGLVKRIAAFSLVIILLFGLSPKQTNAQEVVVDQVVALVGKHIILHSDIEAQYFQYRMQGGIRGTSESIKCQILEQMLFQNLMLTQAEIDSVEVSDAEVEMSMDQRMRYFVSQFGSEEKLEEFYDKTILEIKDEMRELVREQLLTQNVQQTITANTMVSPSDVRSYYRNLPKDSVPLINSEVEIGQIVKIPPIDILEKLKVKDRIAEMRTRIINGENFSTLAILYSEDPGSAKKGGELGFYKRGELYPEFEAAAFKLKDNEVSEIVETEAGFHIIQMIERRGDYINVRHILLMTKPSPQAMSKAKMELDSISLLITNDSIQFDQAVVKFSDDPNKTKGGLILNAMTGTTKFEADELDPNIFFVIDKLEVGELSHPVVYKTEEGKDAYRILYVKSRTKPHRANLKDDYNKLQNWALEQKNAETMSKWVNQKTESTYIRIVDEYRNCPFEAKWIH